MHESTLVEYLTEKATAEAHKQGVQQGVQQGEKKRAIEDILDVLEIRLNPNEANTLKPELEAIDDLQHLKQLHRAAVIANIPEDFRKALDADDN